MSESATLKATRPTLAVLVHAGFPTDCLIDVRELCKSFAGFIGEPVALAINERNELHETLGVLPGDPAAWEVQFVAPQAMAAAAMSSAEPRNSDWSNRETAWLRAVLRGCVAE